MNPDPKHTNTDPLDEIVKDIEQWVRADVANHVNGNKTRDPEITRIEAKQAINNYINSREKSYLKSVLRSRAKTNPDMTIKELYEGLYEQKHDYRGAELNQVKGGQE